jgi:hypothetical protein
MAELNSKISYLIETVKTKLQTPPPGIKGHPQSMKILSGALFEGQVIN